uniref:Uncharacterized protein n=1 Tax=Prolemur simus TaxID=1328070 RepID=A0A8C9DSG8_PROSS
MCGKMYLTTVCVCVCVCVCGCVCVCVHSHMCREGSDLELILHKYPSLYRLIPAKAE